MEQHQTVKKRYRLIDTLRGVALVNMVAFHFCYDYYVIYGNDVYWPSHTATVVWERMICCAFILLSGVSLNFSRHGFRRGLIVSACGLAVTLVTLIAMPDELILFGVLTCIGLCMLITQALRGLLEKCNSFFGAAASFLLFAFFYGLPRGFLGFFDTAFFALPEQLYRFRPLALIGLPDEGFISSDYFPLLPWLFLFVCGFFVWRAVVLLRAERFFLRGVPGLEQLGRYSLWIYMAHQPVLMGVCVLLFGRL